MLDFRASHAFTSKGRPPIAQDNLAILILRHEANLFDLVLDLARPPHLGHKPIPRLDRRREPRLELVKVGWVTGSQCFEDDMRRRVPAVEPVNDDAAEAHLLAGLGGGVEGVVVAVETIP